MPWRSGSASRPPSRRAGRTSGAAPSASRRARAAGDTARTELWSGVLQRLLTPWIEGAAARQDWLAAMSGCALLQEVAPADPLLARYRIPALEGGLRTLRAQGRTAEARGVAEELRRLDPTNALAAEVLGD